MKAFIIILIFSVTVDLQMTVAQSSKPLQTEVSTTYAVKQGRTAPLRELIRRESTDADKKKYYKQQIMPPRNFAGRHPVRENKNDNHQKVTDPIRQKFFNKNAAIPVEPLINRDGLIDGSSPHDPSGDVGLDYYMQAINITQIGLFDKITGELVDQFSANTLWVPLGYNSGGDPIIMFDQEFERWIITEFPAGFSAAANQLLFAISVTSDPMGSYDVYNFTTPEFPDYPKYGVWSNCYSVTTNEGGSGVLHAYFINREEMLAGEEIVNIQRVGLPGSVSTEAGFFVATPVDWSGKTPPPLGRGPIVLALNDASWNANQAEDQLEVFSLTLDWNDESNTQWSRLSLEVSPYDSYPCAAAGFFFSCIPQPAALGLDGIPETIMHQSHYRNFSSHESIVLNFITDVTDGDNLSGIRWMELRRDATRDWYVFQEGTFAPDDGLNRFMGGIAMDGNGNIALAYNVANDSTFAGIRFTGRRSGDPLGTMTVDEYVVVDGTSAINDGTRFGDYAHMTIDPVNDKTFWYTSEYGGMNGSRTRIVAYQVSRDSFDIGPASLKAPLTSADLGASEFIEMELKNFGINTVDSFKVGYIIDGGISFEEQVKYTLEADSIYSHQFSMPVDFSEVTAYVIKLYTSQEQDEAFSNDTSVFVTRHIANIDVGIVGLESQPELICGDSTVIGIRLLNDGFDTIRQAEFNLIVNGGMPQMINYTGAIPYDQTRLFEFPVNGLLDGNNDIIVQVISVNQEDDLIDANNQFAFQIKTIADGYEAELLLKLDSYPEETSWIMEDEQGEIIASGGPYDSSLERDTVREYICLDPALCYKFILMDSYGDGISFNNIAGTYQIYDANGLLLASLINAEFGDQEINEFCATFECSIEFELSASPASSVGTNDGVIMVDVTNGLGPFGYSIDGGDNFQFSNVFNNLDPGQYTVTVIGVNDCVQTADIEILECQLTAISEIKHESDINSADGEIRILAGGEIGALSYSIDGGTSFTSSNIFTDLVTGEYSVIIRDSIGCEVEETIRIGNIVSTDLQTEQYLVNIFPNPTKGVFRIELIGNKTDKPIIPVSLIDSQGKVIQRSQLFRYDDKFTGIMSLIHYPAGNYFVKLDDGSKTSVLHRVVRH